MRAQRTSKRVPATQSPQIPGLLPIRDKRGLVYDFARVDLDDWERLRGIKWALHSAGYAQMSESDGTRRFLHRIGPNLGACPDRKREQVDHINRDKLDNRRVNLRVVRRAHGRTMSTGSRDATYTYVRPNGVRECRTCAREATRRWKAQTARQKAERQAA